LKNVVAEKPHVHVYVSHGLDHLGGPGLRSPQTVSRTSTCAHITKKFV